MKSPRIIICRHAESLEDVDNDIYDVLEDLQIPLTERGVQQANEFGSVLVQLLKDSDYVRFYTSPGVRNVQTLKIVLPKLSDNNNVEVEVEPLIVKQDWGEITSENRGGIENERYRIGVLRYTFPTGESATSMIKRLTEFKDKIFNIQKQTGHDIVIFSHGFEFRVLLKIIMGWDEKLFESFGNLSNAEYRILTMEESGTYALNKPLQKHGLPVTRLKKE
ncbi:MAG TPA: histidine phosphatase family protein [Candidatus Yonathbacteria bacterium]|nr:histidine phosphatase family protein [Candidatus Yonathbacteria bacterium]